MTIHDPIRAALKRLVSMASDELDTLHNMVLPPSLWAHSWATWRGAIAAARAALAAAPVEPASPTDQELHDLAAHCVKGSKSVEWVILQALARWGRPAPADYRGVLPMIISETGTDDEPELERIICASISGGADYVNNMPKELSLERITPGGSIFASYVQAGPTTPPTPAAEEVGELADFLRGCADDHYGQGRRQFARAATLLEQLSALAPQPVALSERLPEPRDCDAEGRCWWFCPPDFWELRSHATAVSAFVTGATHWLPAHALPLPATTPAGQEGE